MDTFKNGISWVLCAAGKLCQGSTRQFLTVPRSGKHPDVAMAIKLFIKLSLSQPRAFSHFSAPPPLRLTAALSQSVWVMLSDFGRCSVKDGRTRVPSTQPGSALPQPHAQLTFSPLVFAPAAIWSPGKGRDARCSDPPAGRSHHPCGSASGFQRRH